MRLFEIENYSGNSSTELEDLIQERLEKLTPEEVDEFVDSAPDCVSKILLQTFTERTDSYEHYLEMISFTISKNLMPTDIKKILPYLESTLGIVVKLVSHRPRRNLQDKDNNKYEIHPISYLAESKIKREYTADELWDLIEDRLSKFDNDELDAFIDSFEQDYLKDKLNSLATKYNHLNKRINIISWYLATKQPSNLLSASIISTLQSQLGLKIQRISGAYQSARFDVHPISFYNE